MSEWPSLDFSKFPNNMISGLTLDEINEIVGSIPDEIINLSNAVDAEELRKTNAVVLSLQSDNLQQPLQCIFIFISVWSIVGFE